MSKNNSIIIGVKVIMPPTIIAHSNNGARNIWEMRVERERKSGNATDFFTVRFPESAYPPYFFNNKINPNLRRVRPGDIVELTGEICSRDILDQKKIFEHIYAEHIEITDTMEKNFVRLCGRVCSNITIFKEPHNERKHAAFKLSIKSGGRRHYIRIAASGELADAVEGIGAGGLVEVNGRMQYREYTKINDGETYVRGVCEVSAVKVVAVDLKKIRKSKRDSSQAAER